MNSLINYCSLKVLIYLTLETFIKNILMKKSSAVEFVNEVKDNVINNNKFWKNRT